MRVRDIAVPVLIFITALIQNAGLIPKTIDAVTGIQLFYALYRMIPASGIIDIVALLFDKSNEGFRQFKTGNPLTTIVSTE